VPSSCRACFSRIAGATVQPTGQNVAHRLLRSKSALSWPAEAVFSKRSLSPAKVCVQCRACESAEETIPPAGQSYEFVRLKRPG
jgi:hypothetical protein